MLMRGVKVHGALPRPGQKKYVLQQLLEATWRCCNGCTKMAAVGISARAHAQPEGATSQSCSGRDSMAANGLTGPASRQLQEATCLC